MIRYTTYTDQMSPLLADNSSHIAVQGGFHFILNQGCSVFCAEDDVKPEITVGIWHDRDRLGRASLRRNDSVYSITTQGQGPGLQPPAAGCAPLERFQCPISSRFPRSVEPEPSIVASQHNATSTGIRHIPRRLPEPSQIRGNKVSPMQNRSCKYGAASKVSGLDSINLTLSNSDQFSTIY